MKMKIPGKVGALKALCVILCDSFMFGNFDKAFDILHLAINVPFTRDDLYRARCLIREEGNKKRDLKAKRKLD